MAENITKIKVGSDVRCISLDTLVIDTHTLGNNSSGNLGVKLGSSMRTDDSGIGVKIHTDTQNYLQPTYSGLSLKLDTMARDMMPTVLLKLATSLNFVIDEYKNTLKVDTGLSNQPLFLGTGLKGVDDGHTLCLSLGSGLEYHPSENKIRMKVQDTGIFIFAPDGMLMFNPERLYELLEARYNLTKK